MKKQNKYDTSLIDKELKKPSFFERYYAFFWALEPLGYTIAFIAFILIAVYVVLMWLTEPSLNGTY